MPGTLRPAAPATDPGDLSDAQRALTAPGLDVPLLFGGISQTERYKDPAQELKHQKQKQRKPVDGAEEDEGTSGAGGHYPYRPYCGGCGKDFTTLTSSGDETTEMAYTCTVESCCFSESRS